MRRRFAVSVGALTLVLSAPGVLGAQPARACPLTAPGEPYLVCQVDRPPRADSGNAPPHYPDMLLHAGVTGAVRVRFIVDTTGRVRPASLAVVESTHQLFVMSVKEASGTWRFEPGVKDGRIVPVRVEAVFAFSHPGNDGPERPATVIARDSTDDGVPRVTIGPPAREPNAESYFSDADLLEAQRSTLLVLMPPPLAAKSGKSRVTACLTLLRAGTAVEPDAETLARLTAPGRRAVPAHGCPRTYASMIYDPRRRPPPGWIDPYVMTVKRVDPWTVSVLVVDVEVVQGTGRTMYRCGTMRVRGEPDWRVSCRAYRHEIS